MASAVAFGMWVWKAALARGDVLVHAGMDEEGGRLGHAVAGDDIAVEVADQQARRGDLAEGPAIGVHQEQVVAAGHHERRSGCRCPHACRGAPAMRKQAARSSRAVRIASVEDPAGSSGRAQARQKTNEGCAPWRRTPFRSGTVRLVQGRRLCVSPCARHPALRSPRGGYCRRGTPPAFMPPSMTSSLPVTYREASDARYSTPEAISAAWPARASGATSRARSSGSIGAFWPAPVAPVGILPQIGVGARRPGRRPHLRLPDRDPRRHLRRRDDRRLGPPALRPAGARLEPDHQRDQGRQQGGSRYFVEAPRHDRVGVSGG